MEGKTQFPTLLTSSINSREDSPDMNNPDSAINKSIKNEAINKSIKTKHEIRWTGQASTSPFSKGGNMRVSIGML